MANPAILPWRSRKSTLSTSQVCHGHGAVESGTTGVRGVTGGNHNGFFRPPGHIFSAPQALRADHTVLDEKWYGHGRTDRTECDTPDITHRIFHKTFLITKSLT